MVDLDLTQDALRTRLVALSVATTGSVSLSATATGFARSTGSFMTDGFRAGMEITGTGFSAGNNAAKTITGIAALAITCTGTSVQAESAGRTLAAALPAGRSWENEHFEPTTGRPYVREQLLPG